jgi:hypothetical protein
LTINAKSTTGDGSVQSGFCSAPKVAKRWTSGLLLPAACLRVRVDLHLAPGEAQWCYSIEVSDPHSRELLAMVIDPSRPAATAVQRASLVSTDLRGILLELTDPDPF